LFIVETGFGETKAEGASLKEADAETAGVPLCSAEGALGCMVQEDSINIKTVAVIILNTLFIKTSRFILNKINPPNP
jgi:hypothetical protein